MTSEWQHQNETLPVVAMDKRPAVLANRAALAAIADFQSDAVELEERPPPRVARATLYTLASLIACAALWATLSEVDEVVIAEGKLITSEPTIVVQPLETSIIRSIDVNVGEIVEPGQKLATLDPTFSQADVDQQLSNFNAFDAQVKRLQAEIDGKDFYAAPDGPIDERLQVAVFRQREAYYRAQIQNFDAQIAGQVATIAASSDQAKVLHDRIDNLARIEAAREGLFQKDAGSLLLLLVAKDARLDVDADLSALQGENAGAEHALKKLAAEKLAFVEDFRRATMEQLVDAHNRRDAASEELKKMELRRVMVTLKAPAEAVVLDLARRSVGSVVRDAEPVVTLVPLHVPLEAEVFVRSLDVARITENMETRIKLDAYPFQKYGTATGKVRIISRDTFEPTQQEVTAGHSPLPSFKARVALTDTSLQAAGEEVRLLPGMTVSAEIKVGRRTIMSYILYPMMKGLDNALREP